MAYRSLRAPPVEAMLRPRSTTMRCKADSRLSLIITADVDQVGRKNTDREGQIDLSRPHARDRSVTRRTCRADHLLPPRAFGMLRSVSARAKALADVMPSALSCDSNGAVGGPHLQAAVQQSGLQAVTAIPPSSRARLPPLLDQP